jgi:hypothetical protein
MDLEHYVCWEQKLKDIKSTEGEESSSVHLILQEVIRELQMLICEILNHSTSCLYFTFITSTNFNSLH